MHEFLPTEHEVVDEAWTKMAESLHEENPMLGQMQNQPLLISSLIEHAERHHGDGEIVSRRTEGDTHRYTGHRCLSSDRGRAAVGGSGDRKSVV